ncbi:hypothetical protein H0H81_010853 [Sphagnurus paluster]|uniref:Uncharacterized protein n=1 Tax=Sphagnurus paluster TaxID=117069 RepID=A0A9P7GPQ6_9AGAR|nr:hypothetical protein H0H81_010853 [Sphagnurus paluster]
MVKCIIPFAHRLSKLSLHLTSPELLIPFLTLPSGTMPLLKTLILLINSNVFNIRLDLPPVKVFDGTPQLKTVILGMSSPIISIPKRFPLAWSQLTCLKFEEPIRLRTFSEIICQCTQLEVAAFHISLHLGFFEEDTDDVDELENSDNGDYNAPDYVMQDDNDDTSILIPQELLTFSHLKSLRLAFTGRRDFDQLLTNAFAMLCFPTVESLELIGGGATNPYPLANIMASIFPSLPSLRHLSLAYMDSQIEPRSLLTLCPELESLALRFSGTVDGLALLRSCHDITFKHLTSFALGVDLTYSSILDDYVEEFCACIEAWLYQCPHCKQFQKAYMHICEDKDEGRYSDNFVSAQEASKFLEYMETRLMRDVLVPGAFELHTKQLESYDELENGYNPYKFI